MSAGRALENGRTRRPPPVAHIAEIYRTDISLAKDAVDMTRAVEAMVAPAAAAGFCALEKMTLLYADTITTIRRARGTESSHSARCAPTVITRGVVGADLEWARAASEVCAEVVAMAPEGRYIAQGPYTDVFRVDEKTLRDALSGAIVGESAANLRAEPQPAEVVGLANSIANAADVMLVVVPVPPVSQYGNDTGIAGAEAWSAQIFADLHKTQENVPLFCTVDFSVWWQCIRSSADHSIRWIERSVPALSTDVVACIGHRAAPRALSARMRDMFETHPGTGIQE